VNRSTILEHGAMVSRRERWIIYHHILRERAHYRLAVAIVDLATIQRTNIRLERIDAYLSSRSSSLTDAIVEDGIGKFIFELFPRAAHLEIGYLVCLTNAERTTRVKRAQRISIKIQYKERV
jgi:hypothetical protein